MPKMKLLFQTTFFFLLLLLICPSGSAGRKTWTNTAGRSFSARLADLSDTHATFVMTDGTINVLAVTALHPDSQAKARKFRELPVIPDILLATFEINQQYLRRVRQLYEEGRLDAAEYADARRRLLNGFRYMYRKHNLPEYDYPSLEKRLLNAASSSP